MTELITIILLLFFNSMLIFGIFKLTDYDEEVIQTDNGTLDTIIRDKMLLWFVRKWLVDKIGLYYSKPFLLCPACMSSVWGTLFYWVMTSTLFPVFDTFYQQLLFYPFFVVSLCGINSFLQRHFE